MKNHFFTLLLIAFTTFFNSCNKDEVTPIPTGDLVLLTQQEVDDFGALGLSTYDGNIYIGSKEADEGTNNPSISNLNALSSLKIINGGLMIYRNTNLINLDGLHNITNLGEVSPWLGTTLDIDYNDNLENIDALSNPVIERLWIEHCPKIENFNFIKMNSSPLLVVIEENESLTSIAGLNDIREGAMINIVNNQNLENLHGLNNLESVSILSIINNNSIFSLDELSNLKKIEILEIELNDELLNLDGLNGLEEEALAIVIKNNISLTDLCGIAPLINIGLTGTNNPYQVLNNAYNPTEQDILDGNCSQ